MKKVLMIATVALLAVACNKNQSAVKKLDGNWEATSITYTEDGVTVDLIETGFIESSESTYAGCKLKDDEFCTVTTTTTAFGTTNTESDLYRVTGDGTVLEQKDDASSTTVTSVEIVELTKTEAEFRQVEDEGTEDETVTVIKMTKK